MRCASCGHAWKEPAPSEAMAAVTAAAPQPMSFAADPPSIDEPPPPKPSGRLRADVSARLREEAAEKRKTREAAAVGAVWAVLGVGFCIVMLGAVVFRTDVVRLVPATAGAYAFARMPVNPTGLAIEAVQGGPGLKDGRAALNVSGVERNVETHPREAQPLRISLIDKAGKKLASQIANPPPGAIQPGETRPFTLSFFDPPLQAASFQVEFAFDLIKPAPKAVVRKPAAPAAPAPPPPSVAMKLRGAAPAPIPAGPAPAAGPPKDAAPLPASSPYALPPAAAASHG